MTEQPQTFFSSTAARADDGAVLIALFNGGKHCVGIFRGSVGAALNLSSNIALALANDETSRAPDAQ